MYRGLAGMAELWLQRSCVSIALRWMQYICCGVTEQKGEADRGKP